MFQREDIRLRVAGYGISAFLLLVALTLVKLTSDIPADLESRAVPLLAAAGISPEIVVFDGRTATLRGLVATSTQSKEAEILVASIEGVRAVKNELAVAPAPPAAPTPLKDESVPVEIESEPPQEESMISPGTSTEE